MPPEPPTQPLIVGAVFQPGPLATFVIAFDRPMDQDGGDDPANWVFNDGGTGPYVGSSLVWVDATHLRVITTLGMPVPPITGNYTQTGGDVRSAEGVNLATVSGFPVS